MKAMPGCFVAAIATGWLAIAPLAMSAELPPTGIDLTTWPRMASPDFGCYLEKTFAYRDKRFNCSLKHYRNEGDVCRHPQRYHEGPAFPSRLATKVHPLASEVALDWEHGNLRDVTVTLKGRWNEADVRRAFQLPRDASERMTLSERQALPENLMTTSVQYSSPDDDALRFQPSDPAHGITLVSLTGFDHMGGGDVDCGNE